MTVEAGNAPLKIERSYTTDSTLGFEIGFKTTGIEVNLTVESQSTTSIELSTPCPVATTIGSGGSAARREWI